MLYKILLIGAAIYSLAHSNDVFEEHGILVERAGSIKHLASVWNIIMLINYPQKPDLTRVVDLLREFIANNTQNGRVSIHDATIFMPRIDKIDNWNKYAENSEGYLPQNYAYSTIDRIRYKRDSVVRSKRGLINAGGQLARYLFGVVTEDQFHALEKAIGEVRKMGHVLYTNQKELLQIFNRTLQTVMDNNYNINKVIGDIRTTQRIIQDGLNGLEEEIGMINVARHIDMHLTQIESCIADFNLITQIFHAQRTQLEHGWINPRILPDHILSITIREMAKLGWDTLSLEWYYKHLHVLPLWYDEGQLAFQVSIPGVSRENYIYFKLQYFDMAWGDTHLRKLQGNPYIALETRTGISFYTNPSDCMGQEPYVCRPSHINLKPTCEVYLITRTSPKPTCYFEVSERRNRTIEIEHQSIESDEIVIVTYAPITITKRCKGETPYSFEVKGANILHLNDSCSLETSEWRIQGLARFSSNHSITYKTYENLMPLNLSIPSSPPNFVKRRLSTGLTQNLSFEAITTDMLSDLSGVSGDMSVINYALGMNGDQINLIIITIMVTLALSGISLISYAVVRRCQRASLCVTKAPQKGGREEETGPIYSYAIDDDVIKSKTPEGTTQQEITAGIPPLVSREGTPLLVRDQSYKSDSYLAMDGYCKAGSGYLVTQPRHLYASILPNGSLDTESVL